MFILMDTSSSRPLRNNENLLTVALNSHLQILLIQIELSHLVFSLKANRTVNQSSNYLYAKCKCLLITIILNA